MLTDESGGTDCARESTCALVLAGRARPRPPRQSEFDVSVSNTGCRCRCCRCICYEPPPTPSLIQHSAASPPTPSRRHLDITQVLIRRGINDSKINTGLPPPPALLPRVLRHSRGSRPIRRRMGPLPAVYASCGARAARDAE